MKGTRALAMLLVAAGLVATPAYAAPTAADRETARNLMEQGRDLRDRRDLRGAMQRFSAANDIMHVPTTALELARAQVALGLLVEARDTVAAMRQVPADQDSAIFRKARASAEELDASLAGRVPTVILSIPGGTGDDLKLTIDGVAVPAAILGLPRAVNPGHHVVVAKTARGQGSQTFDVAVGEHKPVELTLVVSANPVVAGLAVVPTETPTEPTHETETLMEPTSPHKRMTAVTWIGIGVAGAGLAAGITTGVLALSDKSSLSSGCPNHICGPSSYSTLDSANLLATVSDITFGVAGAGALVAIISYAVHNSGSTAAPAPTSSGITVTPWFGQRSVGLTGTF